MIVSDISIRRPVLATVMSLIIVLLGLICFDRLSVREYPKIDPPTVSVRTVYKGATAEIIESVITTPIEDALSGIEGIKTIKSGFINIYQNKLPIYEILSGAALAFAALAFAASAFAALAAAAFAWVLHSEGILNLPYH